MNSAGLVADMHPPRSACQMKRSPSPTSRSLGVRISRSILLMILALAEQSYRT